MPRNQTMTLEQAESWIANAPVGARLRMPWGPDGTRLIHLRGVIDGRMVTREWFRHKRRWNYRVDGPIALMVGLMWPEKETP